ncbi:MAG TPA: DUF1844 domain-containing protein [Methylomirabilota bacterium]|nr:DUF1844 domain-containing protein [Methylomirabilota bacterium]
MSEEESFKVTDRRGRSDASAGQTTPRAPDTRSSADCGVDPAASGPAPSEASPHGELGSELTALFMMFASSALVSLGAVPDPEKDERRLDLGQAQAAIDVLLMLREKTRGNRSEQESRVLEDILYDLQMRFVRASRGSSSPSTPA